MLLCWFVGVVDVDVDVAAAVVGAGDVVVAVVVDVVVVVVDVVVEFLCNVGNSFQDESFLIRQVVPAVQGHGVVIDVYTQFSF